MKVKIETIPTSAGNMYDLVLTQGANTIRLKLTCQDPQIKKWQLDEWIHDNTLDVDDIIRA
jgi:hypothetical protein